MFAGFAPAATVVVLCEETWKFGYAWGPGPIFSEAREACLAAGGKEPQEILFSGRYGFGALCVGITSDGQTAVGVAAGLKTRRQAVYLALHRARMQGAANPIVRSVWKG